MLANERRRADRVMARGAAFVLDLHRPGRLCLIDMSLGGFLLEAEAPYEVDAVTEFLIESHDGDWATRLTGRVVYCHEADVAGSTYMTGWAFVNPLAEPVQSRIQSLFERIALATNGMAAGGPIDGSVARHEPRP
jgi:hypothetical protein